ncbi:MAG: hypothetical protein L0G48_08135 [Staphylococcus equorum]|nr:hypothetical protein [Acinetobacter sp.]MDN5638100.1 hypothetical protein [Staphylococcus equorum]
MKSIFPLMTMALIFSGCSVSSDDFYASARDKLAPAIIEIALDEYQSQTFNEQSVFFLPSFKLNKANFKNCDSVFGIPREKIKYLPFSEKGYYLLPSFDQKTGLKPYVNCVLKEFNKSPVPKDQADKFIESIAGARIKASVEINQKIVEITQDNILTFGELIGLYNLLNSQAYDGTTARLKEALTSKATK